MNYRDQLFSLSRPDDVIEGNLPKLNRDKVPEKLLYFILYCQSLGFSETPNYSGLRKMFASSELQKLGSVGFHRWESHDSSRGEMDPNNGNYFPISVKQSNSMGVPDWLRARLDSHCCVPPEARSNPKHIPDTVASSDQLYNMYKSEGANSSWARSRTDKEMKTYTLGGANDIVVQNHSPVDELLPGGGAGNEVRYYLVCLEFRSSVLFISGT